MRLIQLLMTFALLALFTNAQAVPIIEHWQTSKGARVYFVQTKGLPMLDVSLLFDAGSVRDANKLGLAALTSAMLNQGAADLTAQQIAQQLEGVGAQLSLSTSRDFTSINFRSLTDQKILDQSWAVFKKVISKPSFPIADFERLKKQTLLSIKARGESPATLAQLGFYQKIFAGHPYANPIQGNQKPVEQLKISDLTSFYNNSYVAKNLVVVLVGDLSLSQAKARVNDLLANVRQGEKAIAIPAVKLLKKGLTAHQEYPSAQTHLMYGSPMIAYNDPDYFALYVGNHILGGSGFSSRVVKEIREERGLAYSAYSYFRPMVVNGPFIMGLQTRNEKSDEAATALKETLKTFVKDGPTEEEVIASKKNIIGGFALRLDSNKKLLGNIAQIAASGAELDYLNTFSDKVKQVTGADIKDAFQRRVVQNKMVMMTVGQKNTKVSD